MKWSQAHIPTLRDKPQEAEIVSHQLMMRAGLIRRVASGIYSFLPLGWRVMRKLEQIIREEMDRQGAQEVSLPVVQPRELWDQSGRWALYGKELARLKDRHENEFCLQPTSEEVITDLVKRDVKSYKQLPLNLYQIQTKFRDEIRPRFGIMRGREFIMKDAYSFDVDEASARKAYAQMQKAYRRIFTRTGLEFRPVEADTGAIGGNDSEEFMVLASSGEDEIIACSACDYAANQEKARSVVKPTGHLSNASVEEFATPGLRTIEELASSLNCKASDLMKTMILTNADQKKIVVLLRGDHELHPVKVAALLAREKGIEGARLARDDEMEAWKLPKGSLGPHQFPYPHLLVADDALSSESSYVVGANREGFHIRHMNLARDARPVDLKACIRFVHEGEACVRCGKELKSFRGIEVGHVFYLGTKYSKAMSLKITHESGKEIDAEMGCYGIGVGRTIAACIEQNHDDSGICWPLGLAPYQIGIISLDEGEVADQAAHLYQYFSDQALDVLWDDRKVSPGVKFKDMELIGVPYQIILGSKGLKNAQMEIKIRKGHQKQIIPMDFVKTHILQLLQTERDEIIKKLELIA